MTCALKYDILFVTIFWWMNGITFHKVVSFLVVMYECSGDVRLILFPDVQPLLQNSAFPQISDCNWLEELVEVWN